jgi:hypothetical protein
VVTPPPFFVVRGFACPECGAAPDAPCVGTRDTAEGTHAARIAVAAGTTLAPPIRRPYDRTLEEQLAVPPDHVDQDPRAGEYAGLVYTEAQRRIGRHHAAICRALVAEHRAHKIEGAAVPVSRVDPELVERAREAAARWHEAGCPPPGRRLEEP